MRGGAPVHAAPPVLNHWRIIIHLDLHGRVAHQLATAILRGDYAPGSILPREAELMESFGVSRTVLREALRTLRVDSAA